MSFFFKIFASTLYIPVRKRISHFFQNLVNRKNFQYFHYLAITTRCLIYG